MAGLIAPGRTPDLLKPFSIPRFYENKLVGEKAAAAVSPWASKQCCVLSGLFAPLRERYGSCRCLLPPELRNLVVRQPLVRAHLRLLEQLHAQLPGREPLPPTGVDRMRMRVHVRWTDLFRYR